MAHLHRQQVNKLWKALRVRDFQAIQRFLADASAREVLELWANTKNDTFLNSVIDEAPLTVIERVITLRPEDVDVPRATSEAETPLIAAVHRKNSVIGTIRALLNASADVNAVDADGWSALHTACAAQTALKVIALLIKAGADPNSADSEGHSALHSVVEHPDSLPQLHALLAAGADPTRYNKAGATPLHIFLRVESSPENVFQGARELLIAGADREATSNFGTPSDVAKASGEKVAAAFKKACDSVPPSALPASAPASEPAAVSAVSEGVVATEETPKAAGLTSAVMELAREIRLTRAVMMDLVLAIKMDAFTPKGRPKRSR